MPNINDVAKAAGVSAMTVSRVLNNASSVKQRTRERVLRAMEELNYVPNVLANGLYRNRTRTIALILPDIRHSFFTTIARGVEDSALKHGYRLILCNSDEEVTKEYGYIEMSYSIRVDGVIIAASGDESAKNLIKLRSFGVPFVLIDRSVPGIDADVVVGDNVTGSRQLVNYLIELGHRRISLITAKDNISPWRERLMGYKESLRKCGVAYRKDYVKFFDHKSSMFEILDTILMSDPRPTAIVAGTNLQAMWVISRLRSKGIRVPQDISIVCFDVASDSPYEIEGFMTAAVQPAYRFGTLSFDLLLKRMTNENAGTYQKMILSPDIAIRDSCTIAPDSDLRETSQPVI